MDLRQLRTFVEVVDRGSFSAAAEALGVTQPAVSQQIQSLERAIGTPLVDRSGRRATATPRGEVVHRHALRLLAVREELERELSEDRAELTGHLLVGASTGPGEHLLPSLLGSFRRANPAVTVTLRVEATGTIIGRVLERELELAVVGSRRPHRSLRYEPFLRDRVVLAVPPGHPFAGRTASLAELTREPLIVMQEGAGVRSVMEAELRRAGVRLRDLDVVMEMGLQESAKSAVEAGFGVSFLSVTAIAKELALGTLATAEVAGIDPVRDFWSVRPASGRPSRVIERFVEWCRAELPLAGDQDSAGRSRSSRLDQ
jgi:DNA-binding transcriptional LysR family regulator